MKPTFILLSALVLSVCTVAPGRAWADSFNMSEATHTHTCPAEYYYDEGYFDPGGENTNLPLGADITQTIQATAGNMVTLSMGNFDLGDDTLYVFDGASISAPLITKLYGRTSSSGYTAWRSVGSSLTLRLRTNFNTATYGWTGTVGCGGSVLQPMSLSAGNTVSTCGLVLFDGQGYGNAYAPNQDVRRTFTSSTSTGTYSLLTHNAAMDIGEGDTLFVYAGASTSSPLIRAYTAGSGIHSDGSFYTNASTVTIRFKTNGTGVNAGFALELRCDYYLSTSYVQLYPGTIDQGCALTLQFPVTGAYSGTTYHASNQRAITQIRSRTGNPFSLAIPKDMADPGDTLEIYDGTGLNARPLYRSWDHRVGQHYLINSMGPAITVRIVTNDTGNINLPTIALKCLDAPWPIAPIIGAGAVTNSCQAMLTDPSHFTGSAPANSEYERIVCSPTGAYFTFAINPYDLALGVGDSLFIYDQARTTGTATLALTAGSMASLVYSRTGCMGFRYKTGPTPGQGFKAFIACNTNTYGGYNYIVLGPGYATPGSDFYTPTGLVGTRSMTLVGTDSSKGLTMSLSRNYPLTGRIYNGSGAQARLLLEHGAATHAEEVNLTTTRSQVSITLPAGPATTQHHYRVGTFNTGLAVVSMKLADYRPAASFLYTDPGGLVDGYVAPNALSQTIYNPSATASMRLTGLTGILLNPNDTLFVYKGAYLDVQPELVLTNGDVLDTYTFASAASLTFRLKARGRGTAAGWAIRVDFPASTGTSAGTPKVLASVTYNLVPASTQTFLMPGADSTAGIYTYRSRYLQHRVLARFHATSPKAGVAIGVYADASTYGFTLRQGDTVQVFAGNGTDGRVLLTLTGGFYYGKTIVVPDAWATVRYVSGTDGTLPASSTIPITASEAANQLPARPELVLGSKPGAFDPCNALLRWVLPHDAQGRYLPNVDTVQRYFVGNDQEFNPALLFTFDTLLNDLGAGDTLYVYEGQNPTPEGLRIRYYRGSHPYKSYYSNTQASPYICVRFRSDGAGQGRGMAFTTSCLEDYFMYPHLTTATFSGSEMTLQLADRDFTKSHTALLLPMKGTQLRISFSNYRLPPGSRLMIYDGADTTGPVLRTLTSDSLGYSNNLLTTRGAATVRYRTPNSLVPGSNAAIRLDAYAYTPATALSITDAVKQMCLYTGSTNASLSGYVTLNLPPNYPATHIQTQLSDSSGSFAQPLLVDSTLLSNERNPLSNGYTRYFSLPLRSAPPAGRHYRVRVVLQNGQIIVWPGTLYIKPEAPQPVSISGPATFCNGTGDTLTYTVQTGATRAESYVWGVSENSGIMLVSAQGQPTAQFVVTPTALSSTHTLQVYGSNGCTYSGQPLKMTLTPQTSFGIYPNLRATPALTEACGPVDITFSASQPTGSTMAWAINGQIVPGQTSGTFVARGLQPGSDVTLLIKTDQQTCRTPRLALSTPYELSRATPSPSPVVRVTPPATTALCQGQAASLTATGSNLGIFGYVSWLVGNDSAASGTTFDLSRLPVGTSQVRAVARTSTNCVARSADTSQALTFTVRAPGAAAVAIAPIPEARYCQGTSIPLQASSESPGTISYQWYVNDTLRASTQRYVLPLSRAGRVRIRATAQAAVPNANCLSATPGQAFDSVLVRPSFTPTVSLSTAAPDTLLCRKDTITLTALPNQEADSATFTYLAGSQPLAGSGTTARVVVGRGTRHFTVRMASAKTCAVPAQVTSAEVVRTGIALAATVTRHGDTLIADQAGVTYSWLRNETTVVGTERRYLLTSSGSYRVVLSMPGTACDTTSLSLRINLTDAKDSLAAYRLTLQPNPGSAYVLIRTEAGPAARAVTVRNAVGQMVLQDVLRAAQTELELDTHPLPAGLYFIHIAGRPEPVRWVKQ